LVHIYFIILRLANKLNIVAASPDTKIGMLTSPPAAGTKNAITVDAKRILDKSDKYRDNVII